MRKRTTCLILLINGILLSIGGWCISAYVVDKYGEHQISNLQDLESVEYIIVPGRKSKKLFIQYNRMLDVQRRILIVGIQVRVIMDMHLRF
jgi:hypothetical protein